MRPAALALLGVLAFSPSTGAGAPRRHDPVFTLPAGAELDAGFEAWLGSRIDEKGKPLYGRGRGKAAGTFVGPDGKPLSSFAAAELAGRYVAEMSRLRTAEGAAARPGFTASFFSGMLDAFVGSATAGLAPRAVSGDPAFARGQEAWDLAATVLVEHAAGRGLRAGPADSPWRRDKSLSQ